ncbi:MAG: T9SS type A sorting domain-containing protein [Bacteroidota bacterium]|nr:T9SS type A sorting domain-containing protein [Bacteroidota bacterium]
MKKVLLLSFVLAFSALLNAQWVLQTAPTFTASNGVSISAVSDQVCWFGTDAATIIRTTNGGTTWTKVAAAGLTGDIVNIFAIDANICFATSTPAATNVFKTTDGGATFTQVFTQTGGFIDAMWFFDANNGIMIGDPVGGRWTIFKTTNQGTTWDSTGLKLPQATTTEAGWNNSICVRGNDVWFGTNNTKIYHSTNKGASFTAIPTPGVLNTFGIWFNSLTNGAVIGTLSNVGAGVTTTDGGTTWNTVTLQGSTGTPYAAIGAGNTWMYERGLAIYSSTDNGANWTTGFTFATGTQILDLKSSRTGTTAWAVGDGGVAKGTNIGLPVELTAFTAASNKDNVVLNWNTKTEVNNRGFEVERKSVDGHFTTIGFVTGNGTSTEQHNYSFTDSKLAQGKYSYRLKQLDFNGNYEYSSAVETEVSTPMNFSLLQNYPNPFNPSTVISFNLPNSGNVKLAVYNLLGQEVATLVNGYKDAGTYNVNFNAKNLNSGVYFYKLEAGSFNQTMKMMLTK